MMMRSLTSKNFLTEKFNWQWHYYFLTNEGIEHLRDILGLPANVFPSTLTKQRPTRPMGAPAEGAQLQASIQDTLATMEGPEIFWGSDGVLLGHDEADIKGYDNFDQLAAALSKEGVDLSGGEYTLLAPSNSAFDKHNNEVGTPITADVLKYHVIEGKKTMDALNTDQKTLNGGTLTAYRKFRKNWLDGAIIGLKSEGPSKSSNWPSDVECDNGIIQAIDTGSERGRSAGGPRGRGLSRGA